VGICQIWVVFAMENPLERPKIIRVSKLTLNPTSHAP